MAEPQVSIRIDLEPGGRRPENRSVRGDPRNRIDHGSSSSDGRCPIAERGYSWMSSEASE